MNITCVLQVLPNGGFIANNKKVLFELRGVKTNFSYSSGIDCKALPSMSKAVVGECSVYRACINNSEYEVVSGRHCLSNGSRRKENQRQSEVYVETGSEECPESDRNSNELDASLALNLEMCGVDDYDQNQREYANECF